MSRASRPKPIVLLETKANDLQCQQNSYVKMSKTHDIILYPSNGYFKTKWLLKRHERPHNSLVGFK